MKPLSSEYTTQDIDNAREWCIEFRSNMMTDDMGKFSHEIIIISHIIVMLYDLRAITLEKAERGLDNQ